MNKYGLRRFKNQATQITLIVIFHLLVVASLGCDAFVRKFTRKPKKGDTPKEEMILVPQEYEGPQMTKEELYRQSFLFWKSWHDELIYSLSQGTNHKKQVSCINEAIQNLVNLKALLKAEAQEKLRTYIVQLNELKDSIVSDPYGQKTPSFRQGAERIKRNILRDFSYSQIKEQML